MIDWVPVGFAAVMASIDVLSLGIVKKVSSGTYKMWTMAIATAIYAVQPWIFLSSLSGSSLTIMNLMWDLTSDITVTLVGLFYFREQIGRVQLIGVLLGFVALVLMAQKDGDA
jgi:drug/metabolite transporter (DMT)-like permease